MAAVTILRTPEVIDPSESESPSGRSVTFSPGRNCKEFYYPKRTYEYNVVVAVDSKSEKAHFCCLFLWIKLFFLRIILFFLWKKLRTNNRKH
jgi:hypothetical protein